MATTCPVGFDVLTLRERIREVYDAVAVEPRGEFHFHRGSRYAVEYLGYDPEELAQVPDLSVSRFAGVGNPHRIGVIEARRDRARSRLRWRDRSPHRCAQGRATRKSAGFRHDTRHVRRGSPRGRAERARWARRNPRGAVRVAAGPGQ